MDIGERAGEGADDLFGFLEWVQDVVGAEDFADFEDGGDAHLVPTGELGSEIAHGTGGATFGVALCEDDVEEVLDRGLAVLYGIRLMAALKLF